MKMLKVSICFIIALLLSGAGPCSAKRLKPLKIGVLLFSNEARYLDAVQGVRAVLREKGYIDPSTQLIMGTADANKAKAAELVKKFADAKLDLIITVGTSMTIQAMQQIKDVPIVFVMVYDPVEAGIAKNWKSSGNNTTGSSPIVPMTELLDCLKKFTPAKRLAVLYSPGEKNSESQLRDLQELQTRYGLRIIPVPLTSKEEIAQLIPEIVRTSDALYITGSNLVTSQVASIVEKATKAGVVTITHLEDVARNGVLLGVYSDSSAVGRLAGEKAVKILNGAKPSSIPIESLKKHTLSINMNTARAGRFQIPPDFLKPANKTIQ
jgi:putative ABC transport system substrate-binding protein